MHRIHIVYLAAAAVLSRVTEGKYLGVLKSKPARVEYIQDSRCFGLPIIGYDPGYHRATFDAVSGDVIGIFNGTALYEQTFLPMAFPPFDKALKAKDIKLDTFHTHSQIHRSEPGQYAPPGLIMRVYNTEPTELEIRPVNVHINFTYLNTLTDSNMEARDVHSCITYYRFPRNNHEDFSVPLPPFRSYREHF